MTPNAAAVIARNHVIVGGRADGPPIVFAHGFGCDQTMWRFVEPAFAPLWRTVRFDYVGCGHSDPRAFDATRYASLDGYALDLLEVCRALDLRDAVVVGHSVSAMVALLAAIREPGRFAKLILVAPSPRYIDDPAADPPYVGGFQRADIDGLLSLMDHNFLGWASYLAPLVMANSDRPELADELEHSFCSTDPAVAKVFAHATFHADNRADLARSPVPSLILQVRDDAIAPLAVGRYLRDKLPGSTLEIIETSGHCPHLSHPEATIVAMQRFLDEPVA